jgi:hypothetical protein
VSCVQTPYYLITDADTFFLRSFEALDLLQQEEGCTKSSGVCDLQKQVRRHLCGSLCSTASPCGARMLGGSNTATLRMPWHSILNRSCIKRHHETQHAAPTSYKGVLLRAQVQFRARNEMQNQIIAHESEQIAWLSLSAHVLNVSARLCCMQTARCIQTGRNTAVSPSARRSQDNVRC